MAHCRKQIMQDPAAIPVFHVKHILTSAKLRTGWDRFVQLKGLQLQNTTTNK